MERRSKISRAEDLIASSEDASGAVGPPERPATTTMEEALEIQSRYAAWALLRLRKAQFAADDYVIRWIELFAAGERERLLQEADDVAHACWIAGYSEISRNVRRVAAEIADNNETARNAFINLTAEFGLRLKWSHQHQFTDPKDLARIERTIKCLYDIVTIVSPEAGYEIYRLIYRELSAVDTESNPDVDLDAGARNDLGIMLDPSDIADAVPYLPDNELRKVLRAATAEIEKRGIKDSAPAEPRLRWLQDREPDETPAAFIKRAYARELAAGELHKGILHHEDPSLYRALFKSGAKTDFDLPTKAEWNDRRLAEVGGKPKRSDNVRLYDVAMQRRVGGLRQAPG